MAKSSDLLCDKSLHELVLCHFAFFLDDIFISMTLDCVTSYSGSKSYEIHVNASITVKVLRGISFYVMAENL